MSINPEFSLVENDKGVTLFIDGKTAFNLYWGTHTWRDVDLIAQLLKDIVKNHNFGTLTERYKRNGTR